jgi:hypothetical protein
MVARFHFGYDRITLSDTTVDPERRVGPAAVCG